MSQNWGADQLPEGLIIWVKRSTFALRAWQWWVLEIVKIVESIASEMSSRSPSLQFILLVCVMILRVRVIYARPSLISSSYIHVQVSLSHPHSIWDTLCSFSSHLFLYPSTCPSILLPNTHLCTWHLLSTVFQYFVKYWTDKNKLIHLRVPTFSALGIKWWKMKQMKTSNRQQHKSSCTCVILAGWPWRYHFPVSDQNHFGFPLLSSEPSLKSLAIIHFPTLSSPPLLQCFYSHSSQLLIIYFWPETSVYIPTGWITQNHTVSKPVLSSVGTVP